MTDCWVAVDVSAVLPGVGTGWCGRSTSVRTGSGALGAGSGALVAVLAGAEADAGSGGETECAGGGISARAVVGGASGDFMATGDWGRGWSRTGSGVGSGFEGAAACIGGKGAGSARGGVIGVCIGGGGAGTTGEGKG